MLKIRSIVDPRFKFKQLYYEKKIIRNKIRNLINTARQYRKFIVDIAATRRARDPFVICTSFKN